jgi:putative ABC transport system permease protein
MYALIPRIQAWWLLWLSTVITISIVAASQIFTQRISLLLDHQAGELMAADMLIISPEPLPKRFGQQARDLGLETAITVTLRTAIFIDDEPQLVALKAVSDDYPLRGTLERKTELLGQAQRIDHGPGAGELWIDSKIAAQMNRNIELGKLTLPASWILSFEPDRGGSLFNLAPRILMHLEDLPSTGLLIPGSRARYRLLVAGDPLALQQYETLIRPLLNETQQLQTLETARPEMRNALERTRKFFALSIVLTLVIAMIAIAIAARYSATRESTKVAVMRTFGISSKRLIGYYLNQILKIWLWSLPVGLTIGYLAQFPLQWALDFWFNSKLPSTDLWPYLLASLIGLVSLLGFSLPHIMNVLDTPPMQVFRQTVTRASRHKSLVLAFSSLLTLFLVLLLIVSELKLAALLFALILVIAIVIPVILKLILKFLQLFNTHGFWLHHYLLSRLLSGQRNALFVMSGFSLTLLSVLIISQVKDQIIDEWEMQLPQDKPNYFLANIATGDVSALTEFLQQQQVPSSDAYALIRARLVAINGQNVKQVEFSNERARGLINHTFNISFSDRLPADNEIVEGKWLSDMENPEGFSVEEGMAESLGLKLGDRLRFNVGGDEFEQTVSSIRSVVWENFQPNFFILGTPQLLKTKPQTWLLSAYISPQRQAILKPIVQRFPSVTLLDISEIMQRVRSIIDRASVALQFFFVFALGSGVIVLLSALKTSSHTRELEIALLQALGASGPQKLKSQVFEFIFMGGLVGAFSAFFATLTGWIVGHWFFDLPLIFSPGLWIISIVAATVVLTLVGVLFLYHSFSISPMRLLRS